MAVATCCVCVQEEAEEEAGEAEEEDMKQILSKGHSDILK